MKLSKTKNTETPVFLFGGDEGGRTPYLLNAIQALYQLSYAPKCNYLVYHCAAKHAQNLGNSSIIQAMHKHVKQKIWVGSDQNNVHRGKRDD